jgi:hypothetical protein
MDADLRDVVAACRGDSVDPDRAGPLIDRLRADAEFRRAVVAELAMLGRLKAVQSPEPRWLRLEDELDTTPPPINGEERVETVVMRRVERLRRRRWGVPDRAWLAAGYTWAAACVVFVLFLIARPPRGSALAGGDAVVIAAAGVEWASRSARLAVGDVAEPGPVRIRSGYLTLALPNGVILHVEGPTDLDLLSADRVDCHLGRMRARVPVEARGFTASAPGCQVVDRGTEFALTVDADGRSATTVFEGQVEVSILGSGNAARQAEQLGPGAALEIDPSARTIRAVSFVAGRFASAPPVPAPPLPLAAEYANIIRAARPWGYWRFESESGDAFPNEVTGRPPLRRTGPVRLSDGPSGSRCAVFAPGNSGQRLGTDDLWVPTKAQGYAIEMWALPEGFSSAAMVALVPSSDPPEDGRHCLMTEFLSHAKGSFLPLGTIRAQHRSPLGLGGGVNAFSRGTYRPGRWHHIVAQRSGERLEVYLNGRPSGEGRVGETDIAPCRVLVGRLTDGAKSTDQSHPFVGRLDELALYDRPLLPSEVSDHAALGGLRVP